MLTNAIGVHEFGYFSAVLLLPFKDLFLKSAFKSIFNSLSTTFKQLV